MKRVEERDIKTKELYLSKKKKKRITEHLFSP